MNSKKTHIQQVIDKLYSKDVLGLEELKELDKWLKGVDSESEYWLREKWEQTRTNKSVVSFEVVEQKINQGKSKFTYHGIKYLSYYLTRIAAVMIILITVFSLWLFFHDNNSEWYSLITAPGERTHLVLPDGSEVWLNVDSKLQYSSGFNSSNRDLKLEGEAWFKVEKNTELPFKVKAPKFSVTAVGTEFNISVYANDNVATIYLKEGKVKFEYYNNNRKTQSYEMLPGNQTIVDYQTGSLKLYRYPLHLYGNWRKGELFFDNESMDQVFKKMERWYEIEIHYDRGEFEGETLFVNLKDDESVERLLDIINKAIGIKFKRKENEYWIEKNLN